MRLNKFVLAIFVFIIAVFLTLGLRCFYLQVVKSSEYRKKLEPQQKLTISQNAQRGVIVDSRGRCLAVSKPVETVFVDPVILKDHKETAMKLQEILNEPGYKISEKILSKPNSRFIKIKSPISAIEREDVLKEKIYGVGISKQWKRDYPMGSLFCHVVGIEACDEKWCEGLERRYYDILSGFEGSKTFYVDTFRKPIGIGGEESLPVVGTSLVLTLDSTIQKFTRDELFERCKEYQAQAGMAIVIRPDTGEILSMSCYPDFDPASLTSSPDSRRNRIITDPFEPGSIFKPIFTAIAMDMGVINKHSKIFCENGSYSGKGFGIIGEYGNHSYGNLTPGEILVHSSNIGMAKMGQMMDKKFGKEKIYDAIRLFGFGEKTAVDLPGESSGILNPVQQWNGYSVTRIPYGQEISVTAMQVARAYCILANGGRPVTPHVVKAFVDSNGKTIKLQKKQNNAGYIIKPEVANWIIQDALCDVVKDGTGKKAALEDYTVFGKTGTANIAVNGHFDNQSYVASFAGGAPAENPEIVVLVSICKPNRRLGKGYTGGTVAAPVMGKITQKTLDYLHTLE